MRESILEWCEYLGLKKPVYVTLTTRKHKVNDAWYQPRYGDSGKLQSHRIKVYLNTDTDRDIKSLIAHELIHAWQEENKIGGVHGKKFARKARAMSRRFVIPRIYRPELDTP